MSLLPLWIRNLGITTKATAATLLVVMLGLVVTIAYVWHTARQHTIDESARNASNTIEARPTKTRDYHCAWIWTDVTLTENFGRLICDGDACPVDGGADDGRRTDV